MTDLLSVQKVTKRFEGAKGHAATVAVDGVDLQIPKGQFCVLLGPSGAGKSTLLRLINGMTDPTVGQLSFDGHVIKRRNRRRIQERMGTIHQQFCLVPRLSVMDNVLSGLLPKAAFWRVLLKWYPKEQQRRACKLLGQVGLSEDQLYRKAARLSGGQQQRVAIARAFIREPELVLADEPVASLDPATSQAILKLLRAASQETGATVLCSLHQVELAVRFADRIVAMRQGKLVFDGPPESLDEATLEYIYEGKRDQMRHRAAKPKAVESTDFDNEPELVGAGVGAGVAV